MSGRPLSTVRGREFPLNGREVYFDTASFGLLPGRSLRAVKEVMEARTRAGGVSEADLVQALKRVRQAAARLVGAGVDEITLAPNTSYGVNLAARLAAEGPAGTVVVSEGEFPANVLPWRALESEGFRVERVPTDEHGLPDEARLMERLREDDVRAFALSAVQFATGYRADLRAFGRLCRNREILFCVDAIQALGAVPVDVVEAKVDVLASGGQKWLCSPWGSGFAYIRRALHDRFDPPMVSWLSMADSADFDRMLEYRYAFAGDGRKFELGTLGIQDYVGMSRSIELLLEVEVERIQRHLREVQRPLIEWVVSDATEATPVTPLDEHRRGGIFAFRVPEPEATATKLAEGGFQLSVREGAVRVAPHLYSTTEEMERMVDLLAGQ